MKADNFFKINANNKYFENVPEGIRSLESVLDDKVVYLNGITDYKPTVENRVLHDLFDTMILCTESIAFHNQGYVHSIEIMEPDKIHRDGKIYFKLNSSVEFNENDVGMLSYIVSNSSSVEIIAERQSITTIVFTVNDIINSDE